MIKLIASDLDDTLLDRESNISAENKKTIQEVIKKGYTFTLATGRMFQAALPYALELGLSPNQPLICYNGALIKRVSGEVLYECPLEPQLAATIADYGQERNWTINAYYEDQLYVSEINDKVKEYASFVQVNVEAVGNLSNFILDGNKGLSKLLIINEIQQTLLRTQELERRFNSQVQITNSRPKFIEITNLNAHKGGALLWLANSMGLEAGNVMAIGDGNNDVTMLQMAGRGVAVANASDYVKERADFTGPLHYEHAVSKILQEHILKKWL